jgi:ABC-2 type transport system permease protein
MATAATTPNFAGSHSLAGVAAIYWKEAKYEFWKYIRLPMYLVATMLFPVMFYVLFGLLINRQSSMASVGVSTCLIATFGTFGVMGASLVTNGAGVAMERGLGWMQVKRASPMPPLAYFVAKLAVSVTFSSITVLLLLVLGILLGGVHIALAKALELVLTLAAGAIPFTALGLVIGSLAGPNSAAAVVQLIYIPLSFASGIFFSVGTMPKFMQELAPKLPPYHLLQLALGTVGGLHSGSSWSHWQALIGYTLVFLGVTVIGFYRDEGKMYG